LTPVLAQLASTGKPEHYADRLRLIQAAPPATAAKPNIEAGSGVLAKPLLPRLKE
jgi:hypothetical protein